MSPRALGVVWSFLGVLTFAFALTSVLRSTGSDVSAYLLPLGSAEPFSAALVSWPLLAALIAAVLHLTLLYARHSDVSRRRRWEARVPIFFFENKDVDPETPLGARYQRVMATAFIALPLLLQMVLLLKIAQGTVYGPHGTTFASSLRQQLWPVVSVQWHEAVSGGYRFGSSDTGVSYYPLLTPYAYGLLEVALFVYAARTVIRTTR